MKYTIKAHPTMYSGVRFRSRLEARWAAFFDLIEWKWEYEPIDLPGWSPDFRVEFSCGHSECGPTHSLLVEVKPYRSIEDFAGHPCMDYPYGCKYPEGFNEDPRDDLTERISEDGGAAFGITPRVTCFEIGHGAGGGEYDLEFFAWTKNIDELWKQAGNTTQWVPR